MESINEKHPDMTLEQKKKFFDYMLLEVVPSMPLRMSGSGQFVYYRAMMDGQSAGAGSMGGGRTDGQRNGQGQAQGNAQGNGHGHAFFNGAIFV